MTKETMRLGTPRRCMFSIALGRADSELVVAKATVKGSFMARMKGRMGTRKRRQTGGKRKRRRQREKKEKGKEREERGGEGGGGGGVGGFFGPGGGLGVRHGGADA